MLWYECYKHIYLNSFAPINDRLTLIFTYRLALKTIQGVESVTVYNYLDDCIIIASSTSRIKARYIHYIGLSLRFQVAR